MPGSSPAVTTNVFFPTIPQSQYNTQANAFPSQPELNNNWIKVSYKQGRSTQDETKKPNTQKKAKTGSTKLPLPIATQLY
jgi:hypothetical protein